LHPSNVTRQLQKLPRSAPVVMPEDWIKKMLAHFDFEEGDAEDASKPKSKSSGHRPPPSIWEGSDDDSDNDDDDDDQDDDEDDSDDLDDESQEE
jgi:hypothetical protein